MATPVYIELQEYGNGSSNNNVNRGDFGLPDSETYVRYSERERGGLDEGEEEEAPLPEEDDDPFLYYAMAHEDEDDEDEDDRQRNNRRNNNNNNNAMHAASGWQSKNETSKVAKTLSKYLAVMKLTKERQLSSSDNSLHARLVNSNSNSNNSLNQGSNHQLRQSSSAIQLDDNDLLRAVELGAEEQKCCSNCLPKRLNHVYMCVLLGVLLFVAGGGLLVMGLLSDFEFLEATPHETRLLTIPNTRWFDCLSWRRFAIRQPRANNDRPKSASPLGEAEIYLFDSMPRYTSQPRISSQSRDVDLASDDYKIHYVQFFINAGGVVNFAWSFKTENNTGSLSPIDVLWVKGTSAFESLASLGPGEDTEEIRKTRISSNHYDHYSSAVKESDDYYLAFRRRTKGTPRMIGYINTVVATPVYDLSGSIGKLETFGEMCFPPNKQVYAVLSTTHSGDADDILYISYHYSKRYEFSMALAGALAGVIFVPLIVFWIGMTCRERLMIIRRKRMQDEENPPNAELNNNDNNNNNAANNNNQAFGGPADVPQQQQQPQQPQPHAAGQPAVAPQPANQVATTNTTNNLDEDWW